MKGDILREADEHRLLVEDVLPAVDHPPGKHRRREAVDAPRRVVFGRRTLVDNPQLALGAVVQAYAPVEEVAQHHPRGGALHGVAHAVDGPLGALLDGLLLGRRAQHRGLLATPVPLLCVAEQVARGLDLRVLEAEADHLLDVCVSPDVMASGAQHHCQVGPRDRQELVLLGLQHLQEVVAHELADAHHDRRVLLERRVLQDFDTVVLIHPRQDEVRELRRVEGLNPELLRELQHVEPVTRPEFVVVEPAEVHEAHQRGDGLVVALELDCGVRGPSIGHELLVEPSRLRS
mmetsp:Transcript_54778/g.138369  ORF Transcript_54778/g.138369 Transcript_54778/m.138369 type:complete len:290 (-) Transcript_54778:268-1137(-)